MLIKKIIYIADFSLPNKSAYALHVLKICDAFGEYKKKKVELIIPFISKRYTIKKIKEDYKLKYNIKIKSFYNEKIKLSFFKRIFFAFKISNYLNIYKDTSLIISRSIIPSLFLSFFNIKNILEIHTEMTGLTKYIFFLTKLKRVKKNLKFIFINRKLKEKFNIPNAKSIVLFDAVDNRDFNKHKKKLIKNTCFYSGSFTEGKGLELILKISKKLPNINFHLYGNNETIFNKSILNGIPRNVHFKGYFTYSELTKKINHYKILLMPYQQKVGVLIKNINVANYFSPMKMFEYMAAGGIIIASDLKVYRHILKKNYNSILIKPNDYKTWQKNIITIMKSNKYFYLGKNAKKDVIKYTWILRVKKIIQFNEK